MRQWIRENSSIYIPRQMKMVASLARRLHRNPFVIATPPEQHKGRGWGLLDLLVYIFYDLKQWMSSPASVATHSPRRFSVVDLDDAHVEVFDVNLDDNFSHVAAVEVAASDNRGTGAGKVDGTVSQVSITVPADPYACPPLPVLSSRPVMVPSPHDPYVFCKPTEK